MRKNQKDDIRNLKNELTLLKASLKNEKNQRELLEDIIAKMPGHIYWQDRNQVILGVNNLQAKAAGLKSWRDMVGKTNFDMPWKDDAAALHKNNNLVIRTGKTHEFEESAFMDGRMSTLLSQKSPLRDRKGKIIGVLGISMDFTDRKKAEALQKEKDIIEKTSRHMGMLASSIAHELRTPIAIANANLDLLNLSYSSILADNTEPKVKEALLKEPLVAIKSAIKSSSYIVSHVLITLRTLVANKALSENATKSLSIQNSIEFALANYPFVGNESNLIKWDKKVNFKYCGDDILLQHALFNLIKNALQSIKEAGKGSITIKQEKGRAFNKLIFTDTGAGIPSACLPGLFKLFESKDSTRSSAGLGLAFCKMVMQTFNGDIICKSKHGKYAQFVLSFPK